MGCWGITAFESDTGLDAIGLIRNHLPEQGDVKLQQMIDWLRADSWNAPPEVSEGVSHTSPMAVAELIVKFQEKDFSALDGIRGDKKFSSLSSFTASKESLQWVREYLSETLIRNHLPEQGDVKLQQMIDWLRADSWNAPPEVSEGVSHTSPMAVAELIVKFQEKDFSALDGIRGDKKFSSLSSFTASKESLQWVREYLSETLFYSRKCAKEQEKSGVLWGGWFQERDWKHWQAHMERLIGRMDELLTREGETVALWTGSVCQKVEPGKMAGKKEGEERENPHRSEEESMTFFERELKKLFGTGANFSEPRFVGNCCYGRLTDQIRVKINFQTGMVADHYDRLKVTLLNRNEGMIDSMVVKFGDVWGLKKTTNPNFRDGVNPHIWSYGKEIGWYVYQPGKEDYKVLSEAIKTYLQVFQEPEETMQMGQKMC